MIHQFQYPCNPKYPSVLTKPVQAKIVPKSSTPHSGGKHAAPRVYIHASIHSSLSSCLSLTRTQRTPRDLKAFLIRPTRAPIYPRVCLHIPLPAQAERVSILCLPFVEHASVLPIFGPLYSILLHILHMLWPCSSG